MPEINTPSRGMGNNVVTEITDSVGTSEVTYNFTKPQDTLTIQNLGAVDLIVSVGNQTNKEVKAFKETTFTTERFMSFKIKTLTNHGSFRASASYKDVDEEDEKEFSKQIGSLTKSQFMQRLLSSQVTKIKLIGDSITAGAGVDGYYDDPAGRIIIDRAGYGIIRETGRDWTTFPSWANLFRKYIQSKNPAIDFFNAGVGGISTKEVVDSYLTALIGDNEDVVFVMLGTNDRSLTTLPEYKANIEFLLDYIDQRCNTMIVMTASPSMSDFADTTYTAYASGRNFGAREIDNTLTEICNRKGYVHISHYRGILEFASKTNTRLKDMLQDTGSHPKDKGHAVMWQTIQQKLGFANDVNEWFDGEKDLILFSDVTYNRVSNTTLLTDNLFQWGSITYDVMASSGTIGFPGDKAGILKTVKPNDSSLQNWGYQEYQLYRDNYRYIRYWKDTAWMPWVAYTLASDGRIFYKPYDNSLATTTSLTYFADGGTTYIPIGASNADLANWPEGLRGLLTTVRPVNGYEVFTHQEYRVYQTNRVYKRYYTGSVWGAWEMISPHINTSALPTAAVAYRGKFQLVNGGVGVADQLFVCRKQANDTYAWVQITT